jgi:hypothetical protein
MHLRFKREDVNISVGFGAAGALMAAFGLLLSLYWHRRV